MSNREAATKPYLFSVMQTKSAWSQNTYMPYLKVADEAHLSRDYMGQRLVYANNYIVCENASYKVYSNDDNREIDTIPISHNADGIDTEDRVEKLTSYIANHIM